MQGMQKGIVEEDTYTGYVAHEVRNSLQVLLLPLDSLNKSTTEIGKREISRSVRLGVENLKTVFNNALKGPKGCSMQSTLKAASLREKIQGLVTLYKSVAKEKKLALNVHISQDMPPILVYDGAKIGQVLSNLLNNSIKFTKDGGIFVLAEWKQVQTEKGLLDKSIVRLLLSESLREKIINAFECKLL